MSLDKQSSDQGKSFSTNSGLSLNRIYSPEDLQRLSFDYDRDLGDAGNYPFTRGIEKEMYRQEFWVMGQYSGFGSAEEANKRYRYLLEQGQTGFSIALDLPTQIGLDSDHKLSLGEVGKVGVAIDSLHDIENLFAGIPLSKVRQIRTTANSIGPLMAALLIAFADNSGIDPNEIKIFLQNDPLKEYIARGTYIFPPEASVKLAVDVIEYCAKDLHSWVPMALSGYHIRESGGTAVQEIAFCYANGINYFDEAQKRGIAVDSYASKLFTFFSSHAELIEEIAKFRAARKVWAKMLKNKMGAENPDSMKLKILAYTAGGVLTAQQPLNNIARVTIEALAAVLGGVQTLATSSFDEAFSIPTEQAVTVALRTQQIIAHESGVTKSVDILGGSYLLESLTAELENQIENYLDQIDRAGGAVQCIDSGYFQKELSREAYKHQQAVEQKKKIIVGVNEYCSNDEESIPTFRTDPASEKAQCQRISVLRQERESQLVSEALNRLRRDAKANRNIIPAAVKAAKAYATLGEMTGCLRNVFGEYTDKGIY
jgi:methylmalonyl-CoA mutase, N-terminal domain